MSRTIYVYMATNSFNHAFICTAYAKKQIKAAGLNMRLLWERKSSMKDAKSEVSENKLCLLHITDVTRHAY